jgi:FKBP12-rapamycin complex-associated protein
VSNVDCIYRVRQLDVDVDPEIRTTVLSNLDERLDEHLAQAENVRTLFMALNDEVFENRVEATKLIGRLVAHNPAYAMPLLRKAVLQLMTELEYSSNKYVQVDHRLISPLHLT